MKAYIHENILHKKQFDLQFSIRFERVDDVNFYSPFHWHNHIEVLYVIDGEIDFRIEDRKLVLKNDDLIIVNSEAIHSSKLHGHVSYILLQVPLSAFNGIFESPDSIRFKDNLDKKETKMVSEYLKIMLEYADEKNPENQMKFISLLYELLYKMLTDLRKPDSDMRKIFSDYGIKRISPVMSYVEKNYKEKISLPEAADLIHVTPEHLCRMFKKYTDMTFNEYLMALRISSFYQGLMTTDQKISSLLEENGISNYKVFIREFKQIFGKTPEEVRAEGLSSVKDSKQKPIIKDGLETKDSRKK